MKTETDDLSFGFDDFSVDNLDDFSVDLSTDVEFETRYIKPRIRKEIKKSQLKRKNATDLAVELGCEQGLRAFVIVDGTFEFGDFIEEWIIANKLFIQDLTISTLSCSQENVDSLHRLQSWKIVKNVNLMVSAYFYANERRNLVPYIYDHLDNDNFTFAVSSSHCKTILLKTHTGRKFVIHGSANLRSSSNLEQFCLEESEELYDFTFTYQQRIMELYATIDRPVRRTKLWKAVTED